MVHAHCPSPQKSAAPVTAPADFRLAARISCPRVCEGAEKKGRSVCARCGRADVVAALSCATILGKPADGVKWPPSFSQEMRAATSGAVS